MTCNFAPLVVGGMPELDDEIRIARIVENRSLATREHSRVRMQSEFLAVKKDLRHDRSLRAAVQVGWR